MLTRLAMLAAVFVVVGCSAASAPSRDISSSAPASDRPSPGAGGASISPGPLNLPQSLIEPVVADIAKMAGVPVNEVVVVSAEPMVFPDGSLGCPQPGVAYTQIVVENGYKIVATAGGQTFDYRGAGSSFRRCTNGG